MIFQYKRQNGLRIQETVTKQELATSPDTLPAALLGWLASLVHSLEISEISFGQSPVPGLILSSCSRSLSFFAGDGMLSKMEDTGIIGRLRLLS